MNQGQCCSQPRRENLKAFSTGNSPKCIGHGRERSVPPGIAQRVDSPAGSRFRAIWLTVARRSAKTLARNRLKIDSPTLHLTHEKSPPARGLCLTATAFAQKFENLALTPPMGWNSWNTFAANIDENLIKGTADTMIANGMRDAGYVYIVVDDCWEAKERDADGNIVADPDEVPARNEGARRLPAQQGLQVRHPQLRRHPDLRRLTRAGAAMNIRTRSNTPRGASTS